jgi:hypothetical protein
VPKCANNQVLTESKLIDSTTSKNPSTVPADDRTNTSNVTNYDKLDNKPDNKLTEMGGDLVVIVEAWPQLTEAIRSAIVAIVRASINKQEQ